MQKLDPKPSLLTCNHILEEVLRKVILPEMPDTERPLLRRKGADLGVPSAWRRVTQKGCCCNCGWARAVHVKFLLAHPRIGPSTASTWIDSDHDFNCSTIGRTVYCVRLSMVSICAIDCLCTMLIWAQADWRVISSGKSSWLHWWGRLVSQFCTCAY